MKKPFPGERREHLIVSKEEVKAALGDENIVLINSLSEADFRGETTTYPRPGYIPRNEHAFFKSHSNPETRLLNDDATLRAKFEKIGGT